MSSPVGCPLLLFWPLVREVRGGRGVKGHGEEGEDAVMEMRLREKPQQFSAALLQLSTRYVFILGAQVGSEGTTGKILTSISFSVNFDFNLGIFNFFLQNFVICFLELLFF